MTQTTSTQKTTKTCPRCSGSGQKFRGACFRCFGCGTVDVEKTSRVDPRIGQRRSRLILKLNARAVELDGHANGTLAHEAAWGRDLLESREPERHARALDSIENGRTDAVIYALVAYYHEIVDRFPVGALVAWTMTAIDEDGDPKDVTQNGIISGYYGILEGAPNWIINRNGFEHYVPESQIQTI